MDNHRENLYRQLLKPAAAILQFYRILRELPVIRLLFHNNMLEEIPFEVRICSLLI